MRLRRLRIAGFRGFAGSCDLDLDAEAVIVLGANGQGKTSLFDAVLWGLTGELPRVEDEHVVSLYSETGGARVEVELADAEGRGITAARSLGEGQDGLRLDLDGETSEGSVAEAALHARLWPEAGRAEETISALTVATTGSVYLQQDLVRDFIESQDQRQRFLAISALVGAGTVTELAIALDKAKAAWSGAAKKQAELLAERQVRLRSDEARLESLAAPEEEVEAGLAGEWERWWRGVEASGAGEGAPPTLGSGGAPQALEAAIRRLSALRAAAGRRALAVEELRDELESEVAAEAAPDLDQLREEAAEAEEAEAGARRSLKALEEALAEQRRRRVAVAEERAEARALAELALRHLEGPCPVCGQSHDEDATRARLQEMIDLAGPEEEQDEPAEAIDALAARLQEAEGERIGTAARLREAEAAERARLLAAEDRRRRLVEFGVGDASEAEELTARAGRERAEAEGIGDRMAVGERLALELARSGERALRAELEETIEAARLEVADLERDLAARMRTRELAGETLEELRQAAEDVVSRRLGQIRPTLQRIYRTIDPHPSLRRIELTPDFSGRRGELVAMLSDPYEEKQVPRPDTVLSSSQLNALAVSIFLALNLGLPRLPLETMMLDDPLQSLDDVNLLGLVDLLRRTRASRQMIVSTHDRRFAGLLVRKLRPVGEGGRTRLIELDGWGRRGPRVAQTDAPADPRPLRIAA